MNTSKQHAPTNPNPRGAIPMMVRLPADLAARVRRQAEAGDRTVSQHLRRLIAAAIDQEEQQQ